MGPIRLVIAEGRALLCETMKTVLDGDPDVHADAPGTEVSSVVVMSEELKPDVLVSTGICQMMMAS